jgi:hypothetical protein
MIPRSLKFQAATALTMARAFRSGSVIIHEWCDALEFELLVCTWGSGTGRWSECGVSTACSRGGWRRSSSPPIRNWWPKVTDIVGLYLDPPENAIVLCVGGESQIEASDRAAPTLPIQTGIPERQTRDYVRHDTITLFVAPDIATGKVTGLCNPRHRHQEFLASLKQA